MPLRNIFHGASAPSPRRAAQASLIVAAAALGTGCATTGDEPIPALTQAESAYEEANATARIDDFAGRAMQQARRNLERARDLADEGGNRDLVQHYAFLAEKHVEIAQARLQRGLVQEEISTADRRQQQLLLQAEQRQARQSREEAMLAQQRAEEAEQELATTRERLEQTREEAQTLAAELSELKVKEEERGIVFTLSDVVFDFDSAQLNEGGERSVKRVAETLQEYPTGQILIEGYTDSVGSEEYNRELSRRRAQAVKDAFVDEGIARERIRVEGMGEQYPVASNDTPQGRQLNRRVEIVVATDGKTPQSKQQAASR